MMLMINMIPWETVNKAIKESFVHSVRLDSEAMTILIAENVLQSGRVFYR